MIRLRLLFLTVALTGLDMAGAVLASEPGVAFRNIEAGAKAPARGFWVSDDAAALMKAKLKQLELYRRAEAAEARESAALREMLELEKARTADYKELAAKGEKAARAARSGRFIDRLKFFGLGILLGIPFH